ncbi:MAG: helix-turn-helix domain-containing protein [Oscillatoria sp. PMC 1051.18]|nr:helix-turn-helix domain-containing protein [Oscillatoria sp. PMC 1050.18]MEC5030799.1 helix-turn-helix domain-containing protein [Oscillatoria sp. PMC 1051.18]
MLNLTYQFKLKLSSSQEQVSEFCLEASHQVGNYALAERKDWYKSRPCPINTSVNFCTPGNTKNFNQ